MSALSQQVHQLADQLPPDATWDDVRRRIDELAQAERRQALRAAVRVGLDDIAAGRSQRFESAHDLAEHLANRAQRRIDTARD